MEFAKKNFQKNKAKIGSAPKFGQKDRPNFSRPQNRFSKRDQRPGFTSPTQDRIARLRERLLLKTKRQVVEELSGKEVHIIKAANLIEDLDGAFNLIAEQVIDWHSINFPELKRVVQDNETYLTMIYHIGTRKNFSAESMSKAGFDEQKTSIVLLQARNSIGAEFEEHEEKELKLLAVTALNLKNERQFLLKFLEEECAKIMPNTSAVLGSILAAKMLARAGSLKKLALAPSSRIQIVGAEKALYNHLKTGSKPPKHGIIFKHPLITNAKKNLRGKVARMIASKVSLACRMDYFSKKNEGERLRKELTEEAGKAK